MALSAFDDKAQLPEPEALEEVLGRSHSRWRALIDHLAAEFPPLDQTWGLAGAKWGWSLRLKQRKRTVLYLTPQAKRFLVGFALGAKAVRAAHDAGLPTELLEIIDSAPVYAEGRGVRIEVRFKKDLVSVLRLAAIKMAN